MLLEGIKLHKNCGWSLNEGEWGDVVCTPSNQLTPTSLSCTLLDRHAQNSTLHFIFDLQLYPLKKHNKLGVKEQRDGSKRRVTVHVNTQNAFGSEQHGSCDIWFPKKKPVISTIWVWRANAVWWFNTAAGLCRHLHAVYHLLGLNWLYSSQQKS